MAKKSEDTTVTDNFEKAQAEKGVKVEVHLDKDLNDPRNVKPAGALPSLDDPSQQEKK